MLTKKVLSMTPQERGKENSRRMKGMEMEEEYKVQARVSLMDMANLAIELRRRGETRSTRSVTRLTQAAFEIASRSLMNDEGVEDIEEAIEILEEMELIDSRSSSLSFGARSRNSRREVERGRMDWNKGGKRPKREDPMSEEEMMRKWGPKEEKKEIEAGGIVPGIPDSMVKEIKAAADRYFQLQETPEQRKERIEKLKANGTIPTYTKEQIEYMNAPRDLPGLHPTDRKGEYDMAEGENKEKIKERFEERDSEKLSDQYGE